ncbi:MAG: hypothetical protein JO360_12090 [Acidobacteria bacterium]|nr:hypothetical protein [Acidobacteriota bacterium]
MTTEEHNRTLGIMHLVYGGFHALLMLMMLAIFIPIFTLGATHGRDPNGAVFMTIFMSVIFLFWAAFSVPSFVAGYGLLKRKSWARVWGMIAGGMAGMSFPLGTALCVYSFWFLCGEQGKALYEKPSTPFSGYQPGVLHGAPQPADWGARQRDYTYAPPPPPSSWRDE